MIERVSLAQVKNWGMEKFYGYEFIIQLETFGYEVLPVIHIRRISRNLVNFDFPIILEEYEPKVPNSSEFNYGDKVTVDFELFEKTFRKEMRKLRGCLMNKRQKKKLKKRWGIFHYREYHELRKRFVDYIIKYHIDPLLNEGHNPVIIRKWFILEMWKAFVKTRNHKVLTYKHLRFARNLPKEVDDYAFGYKPNPPIVSLYAREQLPQFEPINTLEVFDNEQTSKEETQET